MERFEVRRKSRPSRTVRRPQKHLEASMFYFGKVVSNNDSHALHAWKAVASLLHNSAAMISCHLDRTSLGPLDFESSAGQSVDSFGKGENAGFLPAEEHFPIIEAGAAYQ